MTIKTTLSILSLATIAAFSSCRKDCREDNTNWRCICADIYDPVCGCNNKTYENPCQADCSGIKDYTKGECGN